MRDWSTGEKIFAVVVACIIIALLIGFAILYFMVLKPAKEAGGEIFTIFKDKLKSGELLTSMKPVESMLFDLRRLPITPEVTNLIAKLESSKDHLNNIIDYATNARIYQVTSNYKFASKFPHMIELQTSLNLTTTTFETLPTINDVEKLLSFAEGIMSTNVEKLKSDFRIMMTQSPLLLQDIESLLEETGLESHLHRPEIYNSLIEVMNDPIRFGTLKEIVRSPDVVAIVQEYLGVSSGFTQERIINEISDSEAKKIEILAILSSPHFVDNVDKIVYADNPELLVMDKVLESEERILKIKEDPVFRNNRKNLVKEEAKLVEIEITGTGLGIADLRLFAEEVKNYPIHIKTEVGKLLQHEGIKKIINIIYNIPSLTNIVNTFKNVSNLYSLGTLLLSSLVAIEKDYFTNFVNIEELEEFANDLEFIKETNGLTYEQAAESLSMEIFGESLQKTTDDMLTNINFILTLIPPMEHIRALMVTFLISRECRNAGLADRHIAILFKSISPLHLEEDIFDEEMEKRGYNLLTFENDLTTEAYRAFVPKVTQEFYIKFLKAVEKGYIKDYIIKNLTLPVFKECIEYIDDFNNNLYEMLVFPDEHPPITNTISFIQEKLLNLSSSQLIDLIDNINSNGEVNKSIVLQMKRQKIESSMMESPGVHKPLGQVRREKIINNREQQIRQDYAFAELEGIDPSTIYVPPPIEPWPINTMAKSSSVFESQLKRREDGTIPSFFSVEGESSGMAHIRYVLSFYYGADVVSGISFVTVQNELLYLAGKIPSSDSELLQTLNKLEENKPERPYTTFSKNELIHAFNYAFGPIEENGVYSNFDEQKVNHWLSVAGDYMNVVDMENSIISYPKLISIISILTPHFGDMGQGIDYDWDIFTPPMP